MKPIRKTIPIQMIGFVTVSQNACFSALAEIATAPICVIPRFNIRSPTLAHTTIARTIISVLIRSLFSLAIDEFLRRIQYLVAARSRAGNGHNRLVNVAALAYPLQSLGAQFQEASRLMVQALALVAVPQRLPHN